MITELKKNQEFGNKIFKSMKIENFWRKNTLKTIFFQEN